MSASLVGSEMCIRDRGPRFVPEYLGCLSLGTARGAAKSASFRAALFGAVSYTHLTLPTICSV
eukprot:1712412-Alexandrium_andersonii.AAC.1